MGRDGVQCMHCADLQLLNLMFTYLQHSVLGDHYYLFIFIVASVITSMARSDLLYADVPYW